MNLSDAFNMLEENKGNHLYDVLIPSTGQKISFEPLTVGQHKSVAKMAIDDEDKFDTVLSALIVTLSNGQIKLNEITEIDKIAILYQIKQNNSPEPLKINLNCIDCESKFSVQPPIDAVVKQIDLGFSTSKKVNNMEFDIVFKMPSVMDNLQYSQYCNERSENMNDDEKSKFGFFIASYEMFLLFVDKISINKKEITDFKENPISERIEFIDKLPDGVINVEELAAFVNDKYEECGYKAKCPKCNYEFENLFSPENFFF